MRIPAVVFLAVLLAPAAVAGEWTLENFLKSEGGGWEGFPVGTFIVTEDVKAFNGREPQKSYKTSSLLRATKTTFVVREVTNGQATEVNLSRFDPAKIKIADAGEETLAIGAEKLACKKKTVTRPGKSGMIETLTVWIHDTHGVVKAEMEGISLTATELAAKRKVGDLEVACRVYAMSGMATGKMVVSMEVAGGTVERVIDMAGMGKIEFRLLGYTRGNGKAPPAIEKPVQKSDVLTKQEIETYIELQQAMKKDVKGFPKVLKGKELSIEAYGELVRKVMTAYAALKRGDDGSQRAEVEKKMQVAKQRIPFSIGMTPAEKREALAKTLEALEAARDQLPTKADVDAARPFEQRLDELAK